MGAGRTARGARRAAGRRARCSTAWTASTPRPGPSPVHLARHQQVVHHEGDPPTTHCEPLASGACVVETGSLESAGHVQAADHRSVGGSQRWRC